MDSGQYGSSDLLSAGFKSVRVDCILGNAAHPQHESHTSAACIEGEGPCVCDYLL